MSIVSPIISAWRTARTEFAGSDLKSKIDTRLTTAFTAAAVGLMALGPANAQEGKFYERTGGKVYEINANAAQGLTPDHWELYLFKRGTTPSPDIAAPGHWGSGTDKDLDKLMESNRKAIAFDHRFERWCGCDGGDLVNDNYFGPIAIMEDENSNQNSAANRLLSTIYQWKDKIDALKEKVDQAQDLWNFLLSATGARSAEQQLDDLQEKVKLLDPGAVKGYVQNLKLGLSGYAGVQAVLEGAGAQAGNIALLLDNTAQELDAAQASGLKIKQALNSPGNYQDTSNFTLKDIDTIRDRTIAQQVDLNGDRLTVHVTSDTFTKWESHIFLKQQDAPDESDCPPHFICDSFHETEQRIWKNVGRFNAPFEWSAPVSGVTAKLLPERGLPLAGVVYCEAESSCIQMRGNGQVPSQHAAFVYFPTQDKANDFIAKFNAQKAMLSNRQKQQTQQLQDLQRGLNSDWERTILSNPTLLRQELIRRFGAPKP